MKALNNIKLFLQKVVYKMRYINELRIFGKNDNVHDLPEIFHYWANKYLLPKAQLLGFNSPDDFFYKQCKAYCLQYSDKPTIKIISIGSGNGELEVGIAQQLIDSGINNFTIECMDINAKMHQRTIKLAESLQVAQHIITVQKDFNQWQAQDKYDVVIANQSLHHVVELEHLFNTIDKGLQANGVFITSDMIGRNGHMRWPEALEMVQDFWKQLPASHTYNGIYKRYEKHYINHDCSVRSFEGVRSQDILPLLIAKFDFKMFFPFANIISIFIDRSFGHNFNVDNDFDRDFIDRVHAADEQAIMTGKIKPTQMVAVMTKKQLANRVETVLIDPQLTPQFCVRNPDE